MTRNQNTGILPYAQGGTPGALVAFTGTEAILSVIVGAISVISSLILLFSGYASASSVISFLISAPLTIYSVVLSFRVFLGLKTLHRGDSSGAGMVSSVCKARRILIWVAFALVIVLQMITTLGASYNAGASFLALLISAGLSLLIIIPVVLYYKDAESIMDRISYEGYSDQAQMTNGFVRLSVWCILYAVLLMILSVLLISNLLRNSSILYQISSYKNVLALFLFLLGARFLLVHRCRLGFLRSHAPLRDDPDAPLAPAGYSDAPALCVLGSIAFGWFAVAALVNTLSLIFRMSSYGYSIINIILNLLIIAAYVLLGLALSRHQARIPLAITGAGCFLLSTAVRLFNGRYFTGSDFYAICSVAGSVFLISFLVLFIVGMILRNGNKTIPAAIRIIMIVLAGLYAASSLGRELAYSYRFDVYSYVSVGLFLIAHLAMVRLLWVSSLPDNGTQTEKASVSEITEAGIPQEQESASDAENNLSE